MTTGTTIAHAYQWVAAARRIRPGGRDGARAGPVGGAATVCGSIAMGVS